MGRKDGKKIKKIKEKKGGWEKAMSLKKKNELGLSCPPEKEWEKKSERVYSKENLRRRGILRKK